MNEKILVEQIVSGEEAAFKTCFDLYADKVYNTCLGLLQNTGDAEDTTQETFIEVFKSIHTFRFQSSLSTWIYRIALNKSKDLLKKQRSVKRFSFVTSLFGDDNELIHDRPHLEHPGVLAENKELAKILFAHIGKLPEKQKTAFTLHKLEHLSHAEIAEIMQLSHSAVESLIYRANENLKKSLSAFYKKHHAPGASFLNSILLML
jgi:RNA polymerase sigma-70 factor (ECF subfamily)